MSGDDPIDLSSADDAERAYAEVALDALREAMQEDDPAVAADPGLPDDYVVLDVLGRGASGVVYRARQKSLDREVAVKVVALMGWDARDAERLDAEARRIARLSHAGIVRVFDVGRTTNGGVYLTLELQSGGSLQSVLQDGALNPGRAARVARQAAEALAYMHERGVVHLDLKPANVLLDEHGDVRIADFGLARELESIQAASLGSHTTSAGLIGTPAFMAPEQAANDRGAIGERTDVYGLGAVLYGCVAGRPPFGETALADLLDAVRYDEPASLDRAVPGTPRDLAAIVSTAMSKDPAERYPNAKAMAQDLARYEAGSPVLARAPGPFRRTQRLIRRHTRELVIAASTAVVSILSLIPFSDSDGSEQRLAWIRAADHLTSEGETRAAAIVLDRLEAEVSLTDRERDVVDDLRSSFDAAAARPASVRRRTVDAATEDGSTMSVAFGAWLVMDDGRADRIWRGKATADLGETLRFDGAGRTRSAVPAARSGFDLLHVAPPGARPRPNGAISVEAGGEIETRDGRLYWHISDNESWTGFGPLARSTFVDLASNGLSPGAPILIEAQRFQWEGGGATVVMFAEAALGPTVEGAARSLDDWLNAVTDSLERDLSAAQDVGDGPDRAPSESIVDRVIAISLLGDERARASMRDRSGELEAIGSSLSPDWPETSLTRTGGDVATWLALAEDRGTRGPGPSIDTLPRSHSMESELRRSPTKREFIWMGYVIGSLLLLIGSRRASAASKGSLAGGALILAGMTLDKRVTTPLGSLSWDPLACLLLAAATWGTTKEADRWSRAATWLFLVAAAQSALVSAGVLPDLRIPLLLAFVSLALAGRQRASTPNARAAWAVLAIALTATFTLSLARVGPSGIALTASYLCAVCVFTVLVAYAVAQGNKKRVPEAA
ncbi:MAG: serine/threonine-protein kinase [Planctomycetota bacterium]